MIKNLMLPMRLRKYFDFVNPSADARIKEFYASLICIRNARNLCTNRPVYETPLYEPPEICIRNVQCTNRQCTKRHEFGLENLGHP